MCKEGISPNSRMKLLHCNKCYIVAVAVAVAAVVLVVVLVATVGLRSRGCRSVVDIDLSS